MRTNTSNSRRHECQKGRRPTLLITDLKRNTTARLEPDSSLATTDALRNLAQELVHSGGKFKGENRIRVAIVRPMTRENHFILEWAKAVRRPTKLHPTAKANHFEVEWGSAWPLTSDAHS